MQWTAQHNHTLSTCPQHCYMYLHILHEFRQVYFVFVFDYGIVYCFSGGKWGRMWQQPFDFLRSIFFFKLNNILKIEKYYTYFIIRYEHSIKLRHLAMMLTKTYMFIKIIFIRDLKKSFSNTTLNHLGMLIVWAFY